MTQANTPQRFFSRRETLKFMGAAGAASILGLGEFENFIPHLADLSTGKAPDQFLQQMIRPALYAAAPVDLVKTESAVACVARPALTEGPFFVDEKLNRSDIRSDPSNNTVKAGTKLTVKFTVYRSSNGVCTPLSGAYVDLWHCDATGGYSDVSGQGNPNNLGQKFLRGYQISDANGTVQFTTIYPGWYSGRTVHMHYKVRLFNGASTTYEFTSQLCFDDSLTDTVFLQSPYSARPNRNTRNTNDNIYQSGGSAILLTCTPDGEGGYTSSFDLALTGLPATTSSIAAVSGASYAQGAAVTRECITALFGNGLAVTTQEATTLPLPTALGDTTVTVRDATNTTRSAQLFYASPAQINILIPTDTANGSATLTALQSGNSVASGTITVANVAPGLFAANADAVGVVAGYVQRIRADRSQSIESIVQYDAASTRYVARAIDLSSATDTVYLIIFGTGIRNRSSLGGVTCELGGFAATVEYAGAQGFYAGLDQVNLLLPQGLAGKGEVQLILRVDGVSANTLSVKFA